MFFMRVPCISKGYGTIIFVIIMRNMKLIFILKKNIETQNHYEKISWHTYVIVSTVFILVTHSSFKHYLFLEQEYLGCLCACVLKAKLISLSSKFFGLFILNLHLYLLRNQKYSIKCVDMYIPPYNVKVT